MHRKLIRPFLAVSLIFSLASCHSPSQNQNISSTDSVSASLQNSDSSQEETVSAVPAGTYQVIAGNSGLISSIRIFQLPDQTSDSWYCDIISWSPYDRTSDILNDYNGPANVPDDLQNIECGDFTFSINENGSSFFDDTLVQMGYDITYYSPETSMEEGLNALIELSDSMSTLSFPQSAINHYIEQHSLNSGLVRPLAAYTSDDERVRYSIFNPNYYDYDSLGATNDLNPEDPDHVYNVADDGNKSDEELTEQEFEQKYDFFFGYCFDYGKTHDVVGSDPTGASDAGSSAFHNSSSIQASVKTNAKTAVMEAMDDMRDSGSIHNYRLGLVSVQESTGVLTVTIPLNIWYDPGSEDDKWTATVIYNASTGERISLTIA